MQIDQLKNTTLCLGVAGNFAGHLEQAGETPDFVNVKTQSATAPKGIFPYYVPGNPQQIGVFPLADKRIQYPTDLAEDAHLQAEPEVCVLFDAHYEFGKITELKPRFFAAFNDCSIRKPGAKKISEKKNWGEATKGIAGQFLPVTSLAEGGELDTYRIASFLERNGEIHAYGNDSAVTSYSYFHQQLMQWMIDKLNHQADFGPLENLNQLVHQSGFPKQIMVSLGATTYTEFGESVFLQPGDRIAIYVYNNQKHTPEQIAAHAHGTPLELNDCSLLRQEIV
ncbi:DUF5718 family protein [Thiomicrorhabdus sp.]|uniref:DUF5718 family protein n=1 Tax=Thiomicrorhabdus sp. TaxID=2039724 RepID=UPI0029C88A31|nr:DUF5718 family protein [Thiomicrorhabdus sp.]